MKKDELKAEIIEARKLLNEKVNLVRGKVTGVEDRLKYCLGLNGGTGKVDENHTIKAFFEVFYSLILDFRGGGITIPLGSAISRFQKEDPDTLEVDIKLPSFILVRDTLRKMLRDKKLVEELDIDLSKFTVDASRKSKKSQEPKEEVKEPVKDPVNEDAPIES
jgi:hypothetical protein